MRTSERDRHGSDEYRSPRGLRAEHRAMVRLTGAAVALVLSGVGMMTRAVTAQQPMAAPRGTAAPALVFDGVTVVDVEQGKLVPQQRVVIAGHRIQAVGAAGAVTLPPGARVIDARGKYLIPGLWDMHVHPWDWTGIAYPLFLANGITGIRDAGSTVPLATLRRWRQEILAGRRVGPPRQLLAGPSVGGCTAGPGCAPGEHATDQYHHLRATSPADARLLVDSLVAAGADFIKSYAPPLPIYFAMAAEARRRKISFEGHLDHFLEGDLPAQLRVSVDSGQRVFDHVSGRQRCGPGEDTAASLAACQQLAALLRQHDAWLVATPNLNYTGRRQAERHWARRRYMPDSIWRAGRSSLDSFYLPRALGQNLALYDTVPPPSAWSWAERAGLPLMVGTDLVLTGIGSPPDPLLTPGFVLHDALELLVDGGLSPLGALRAATLAPAQYLHATDSLGTVAAGKLADLVLLGGDPLADIRNTTKIVAVVANGRYFDRAALDHLLADAERAAAIAPAPRRRPTESARGVRPPP